MIKFYEYLARSCWMTLPDNQTTLTMAGVVLDVPTGEEAKRVLNKDKKRQHTVGKSNRMLNRLDRQPLPPAAGRL